MRASISRREGHLSHRSNWLRAAVLGANDGILSTASLVLSVAASGASGAAIVTAASAGLVAGTLSMAAGGYVSVSSQRDAEQADIRLEERELRRDPRGELRELAGVVWWPPGKINGRYLTPWLAALEEDTIADHLPHSCGLAVQTDLHRDVVAS